MTQELPPNPAGIPVNRWARELFVWLRDRNPVYNEATPRPVALSHAMGDERALQDGVMMWDTSLGTVVVSKNGAWVPLVLDTQDGEP